MKARLISQAFGETIPETEPVEEVEECEEDEGDDEEDGSCSRFSSEEVNDRFSAKVEPIPLKVPVLKLKVSGAFVDTGSNETSLMADCCLRPSAEPQSDVDTTSENQSATHGRLSSGSEQDDQSSEVFLLFRLLLLDISFPAWLLFYVPNLNEMVSCLYFLLFCCFVL